MYVSTITESGGDNKPDAVFDPFSSMGDVELSEDASLNPSSDDEDADYEDVEFTEDAPLNSPSEDEDTITARVSEMTDDELYDIIFDRNVETLRRIEYMARGWQTGSPLALLGTALGKAICDSPTVQIDSGQMTGSVPLNLLMGYIGRSGQGKGVSMKMPLYPYNAVIRDESGRRYRPVEYPHIGGYVSISGGSGSVDVGALPPVVGIHEETPASGEKFIDMFYEAFEMPEDPSVPRGRGRPAKNIAYRQRHEAVWADWSEVDAFYAKAKGRNGAVSGTLESYIRSAFSGEPFGDSSMTRAAQGKPCRVSGRYTFVGTVGVQPTRAAELLDDGGGGTLQRFLYLPVRDPNAAATTTEILTYRNMLFADMGLPTSHKLSVKAPPLYIRGPREAALDDEIIRQNQRRRSADLRGESDDELTHSVNVCIRLAAIYGVWVRDSYEPFVIGEEEWLWANAVFEVSRRELAAIRRTLRAVRDSEADEMGRLDAIRARRKARDEDAKQREVARDVAKRALKSKPGSTVSQVKNYGSAKQRKLDYEYALRELEADGRVHSVFQGGHERWYLGNGEDE